MWGIILEIVFGMITILFIFAFCVLLGSCQIVGQRYHQGDRWEMYRLDKDYKPIRVYPREVKENGNV